MNWRIPHSAGWMLRGTSSSNLLYFLLFGEHDLCDNYGCVALYRKENGVGTFTGAVLTVLFFRLYSCTHGGYIKVSRFWFVCVNQHIYAPFPAQQVYPVEASEDELVFAVLFNIIVFGERYLFPLIWLCRLTLINPVFFAGCNSAGTPMRHSFFSYRTSVMIFNTTYFEVPLWAGI